ncbi:MAG: thioredoxin family protein [Akkermansiaceae bacterium]|nr:thioredoxin family protein [Akkermansiaceae bacterium]
MPAHLMASPEGGGTTPLARVSLDGPGGGGFPTEVAAGPLPVGLPADEDIAWTDPDNPEAPLEGMEASLASQGEQVGGWETSYTEATRNAVRKGRPILIWFTDTKRSPLCKSLSAEVFSDPSFDAWAFENLVRLRIDFNVTGKSEDEELRKKAYLAKLKKRYKVSGLPMVLVMAPDGTVTGRYKGYRQGEGEFYWGRIKNATITAQRQQVAWMAAMKKKGYRVWKNRKGKQVFARLLRYSKGEMLLVEPRGKRLLAKEKQLSDDDRAWIQSERAKRAQ